MSRRRLGDYELLERIGAGGMGLVYRARDAGGREVALKLGPVPTSPDDPRLERFRREGWITADLRHPQIVPIHDAGIIDGRPYLAFALVDDARTLDDALPTWPLAQRVAALRDVALGLAHAHRAGIVHRDVKPSNVLVCPDDRVLLADFGVASVKGLDGLTQSHALLGTPLYMAPEVVREGASKVGPPADVYALGVMLYEALTDEHPYAERGLPALYEAQLSGIPTAIQRRRGVPDALSRVCERAMHVDPAQRYPSAAPLAEALQAWLDGKAPAAPTRAGGLLTIATLVLVAGVGLLAGLRPQPASPTGAGPSPERGADAASPPAAGSTNPRPALIAQALERLAAGASPASLHPLLEELAGLPQGEPPAPTADLGDRLVAELPALFRQDPREGLRLLEAMALAGLRTRDRRRGDAAVDALYTAHLLESLTGADYWRGLAAAARIDAPVRGQHCSERAALRRAERPTLVGTGQAWLEYVELLRLAMQGRVRQVIPELRALLDTPESLVPLGPRGQAMVAVLLLSQRDPESESLLSLAQAYAPDDPLVWRAAGFVAITQGQYARALSATQRALDAFDEQRFAKLFCLAPERPHMLHQLLRVHLLLGDRTAAMATYRELKATSVDVAQDALDRDPGLAELVEEADSSRDD